MKLSEVHVFKKILGKGGKRKLFLPFRLDMRLLDDGQSFNKIFSADFSQKGRQNEDDAGDRCRFGFQRLVLMFMLRVGEEGWL